MSSLVLLLRPVISGSSSVLWYRAWKKRRCRSVTNKSWINIGIR
ncbi:hypothetical protein [Lysobacter gummosus]